MDMLEELNYGGKTMIISNARRGLSLRWADEVILMEDGGVLRKGTGPEIFGDWELIKRARLKLPLVVTSTRKWWAGICWTKSRPPRNILELTDLVQAKDKGANSLQAPGKIYISDVDGASPEEIKSTLERFHAVFWSPWGPMPNCSPKRPGSLWTSPTES